ncbi:transcriptional regulator [Acidithiobacillus thiooxidans]|uniref:DUF6516 family protein n=1 Tax=Acidithiobacillus TaxID=119977 RepID=UPI0005570E6C|nr:MULTISPECIES: DUF6516 family protein [Acidithiobacillus]MBU2740893.1 transcriptional regulator [Acidithiobacillus albertensis]MBU2835575.1 transcriptional regulator [Acidithiobacillus thiooxidans]MDA8177642.1 DUF6516 family protein [Acidithiobacillus sp.]
MADKQLVDEVHHIYRKRGNGQLRREVWVDERGEVTRYNLAYINHAICAVDNGRVVGYDNQHGYHHRHYLWDMHPIDFISFEDIEVRFEEDWMALRRQ